MARKKKEIEDKELTLEEAKNVVRRLAHPKHVNQEDKLLKEAAAVLLKENEPGFEFGDEEDESVNIDSANAAEATSNELTKPPSFLEHASSQIASLGTAGVMAIASATYFQIDTVVEQTREVVQVAEQKWEEFEEEHPGFNWDDPLEAFTTVVGIGELDIDIDPTTGTAIEPETEEPNESTNVSETTEQDRQEEPSEENTKSDDGSTDEESTKDSEKSEVEEEPKKKKKKGFLGLFGGNDDEAEEDEEQKEEPAEEESNEPAEEETEAEEESSEPEPEAEEEPAQEEKPKKKSGGLFSSLFGGNDDKESEEPEDEPREEPTQDDTIPDESENKETDTEPETKTNDGEVAGGESTTESVANADTAESDGVEKKSSGGGLLSLFGLGGNKEVVEDSEISTDEEPKMLVADSDTEVAKPPSEEPKVEIESIDGMDDIKPHSMVGDEAFTETEINIEDIIKASESIKDVEVAIDVDDVVEQVLTPIDGNVVSPAGEKINWADIFDPNNPSRDERDATPI